MSRVLTTVMMAVGWHAAVAAGAITEFYFYPAGPEPAGLPPPSATSTNIAVADWYDAQVHSAYPLVTFGMDELALATATNGVTGIVLVSCSSIYEHIGALVQSAELRLYTCGAAFSPTWLSVGVARVTSAWQEDTVTWATQPSQNAIGTVHSAGTHLNTQLVIDVRDVIEAERLAAPSDRHGLALVDLSGESPLWFMKESGMAAYRPYLYVLVPEPVAGYIIVGGILYSVRSRITTA